VQLVDMGVPCFLPPPVQAFDEPAFGAGNLRAKSVGFVAKPST
jgi:hypothetical protein